MTGQIRQVRGIRRGDAYNTEIETFFDDRRTRNLRVMVSADNSRLLGRTGWM